MSQTPNPEQHEGSEQPPSPQPPNQPPPNQPPAYQPPAYQQPAYQQPGYQQPHPPYGGPVGGSVANDRTWAGAAHWGSLVAAWLAMGFLAPLIIMFTVGERSPFVRRHAVESLNFQISLLIYSAVGVLFTLLTLGLGALIVIPVALAAVVAALIFIILASVRAQNGEDYRYPLTIRLVH